MLKSITKLYVRNRYRFTLLLIAVIVAATLRGSNYFGQSRSFPEISELQSIEFTTSAEIERYFKSVAEKKGAGYAFDLLKIAPLPDDVDIHLLGHAVGNILYKQEGLNGIKICNQDFRNACSHSIVVGLFIERGIEALDDISSVCRKAPGGIGAYTMCFHGLGHGILAYTDYNLVEAVNLCKKTETEEFNHTESAECVGGAIMEMVGGVHDRQAWEKAKKIFFKDSDPLYPCNQDFIPDNARHLCFLYLTPHLWEAAGVSDPVRITEDELKISFDYCSRLSNDYQEYQNSCYAGFGKEFVVMADGRDIRNLGSSSPEALKNTYQWCTLAGVEDGVHVCFLEAVNSLYWGGENSPKAAVNFCSLIDDGQDQELCFTHLIGAFKFYTRGKNKLRSLCNTLPENYSRICHDQIY
jgi:hypothetical protein